MSAKKEPAPSPEEVAAEMDRISGRGLGDLGYDRIRAHCRPDLAHQPA